MHNEQDIVYMGRCLQLAANGLGRVRPNPMVGCVVVKDGRIVSEGYHQYYGGYHAERNALLRPLPLEVFRGATLYVNLEPCSHYGKRPPAPTWSQSAASAVWCAATTTPTPSSQATASANWRRRASRWNAMCWRPRDAS